VPTRDFDVRLANVNDVDEVATVLAVLGDGYGRPFTETWFRWKHVDNPWGLSRCWVAVDEGGLLGVVFGMPWRLFDGSESRLFRRLVDGATTIRAQRRGVFRAVAHAELAAAGAAPRDRSDGPGDGVGARALVFATATPEARDAHVKNGATALEPISSFYCPVRWSSARVESGLDVGDDWCATVGGGRSTDWGSGALGWRTDHRSGLSYVVSRLIQSDQPHGVVHRTVGRTLVVSATWGPRAEVRTALRAIARQQRCILVLQPAGVGTPTSRPRPGLARGESLMCVWEQHHDVSSVAPLDRWSLSGLDLEGVM
jgi:hypothetical protein